MLTGAAPTGPGAPGAARTAATDLRVGADGTIAEMGRGLAPLAGERVLDASGAASSTPASSTRTTICSSRC
ncbi:MAG: hypothetical protein U1F67_19450 [Rubrivivax sp.]